MSNPPGPTSADDLLDQIALLEDRLDTMRRRVCYALNDLQWVQNGTEWDLIYEAERQLHKALRA